MSKLKDLSVKAKELTKDVQVDLDKTLEEQVMSEQKKTETVEKVKKEMSLEERQAKKNARRAGMTECGRLHLAEDLKEKGYSYRVCNVLPGNIENYKSQGYEVVTHSISSGTGSLDNPEVNGVPQEFEVGGAKGSMKAVWMRIRDEDKEINDEIRDDLAREQDSIIRKNPGIPEDQLVGKITKENLR